MNISHLVDKYFSGSTKIWENKALSKGLVHFDDIFVNTHDLRLFEIFNIFTGFHRKDPRISERAEVFNIFTVFHAKDPRISAAAVLKPRRHVNNMINTANALDWLHCHWAVTVTLIQSLFIIHNHIIVCIWN